MHETKQQVTQRKIRNGLRKQAAKIQAEKEKVWDILKTDTSQPRFGVARFDNDIVSYYPYRFYYPQQTGMSIIDLETTA